MIIVVIPAYRPGEKLLWVAAEILKQTEYSVLVVNDGSGSEYDSVFAQLPEQVTVLCHIFYLKHGFHLFVTIVNKISVSLLTQA